MWGENAKIGLGKFFYCLDRVESPPHQLRELKQELSIEFLFFPGRPFLERYVDGVREDGYDQGKDHHLVEPDCRCGRCRWSCRSSTSGRITVFSIHLRHIFLQCFFLITYGSSLLFFCGMYCIAHQECGQYDQQCYRHRQGNREEFPRRVVLYPYPLNKLVELVHLFMNRGILGGCLHSGSGSCRIFHGQHLKEYYIDERDQQVDEVVEHIMRGKRPQLDPQCTGDNDTQHSKGDCHDHSSEISLTKYSKGLYELLVSLAPDGHELL